MPMTETLDIKISRIPASRLQQTDFDNLPFGKTFSDHMFVADYADGEWKNLSVIPLRRNWSKSLLFQHFITDKRFLKA
jgi:hypothetical protein